MLILQYTEQAGKISIKSSHVPIDKILHLPSLLGSVRLCSVRFDSKDGLARTRLVV